MVADAIAWHHAAPGLALSLPSTQDPRSILARAAIYRLMTSDSAAVDLVDADPTYVKDNVEADDRILSVLRKILAAVDIVRAMRQRKSGTSILPNGMTALPSDERAAAHQG